MGAVMAAFSVEARRRLSLSRPSCLSHCGQGGARYHRSASSPNEGKSHAGLALRTQPPLHPGVMGIQGMELFAIGVVIILFMAVLKQFGILEPMSSFEDSLKIENEEKMSVRWETEGLQTVGIVCLVIMFLKLMHLLGLIDITETGLFLISRDILSTDATTYAHFLFNAFDIDRNGSIRFEDFVIGLSVLLRGSITEKLNWAFNLYDINKDGYITKEEMLAILKSIYDMMGRYTYPCVRDEAPYEHVDKFFQKMDKNRDGVVTIEEFIETCQKDENIMNSMQLFENVI
ncbi:unnamed protein product, partial [Tetraodon nigroviridis]